MVTRIDGKRYAPFRLHVPQAVVRGGEATKGSEATANPYYFHQNKAPARVFLSCVRGFGENPVRRGADKGHICGI